MTKTILCFLVAICAAQAVPVERSFPENNMNYPRFIIFPDGDENPHTVDLQDRVDSNLLTQVTRNPANNRYVLFTRRNPTSSQNLVMNNENSIRNSNFNRNHPTVVIAHGWLSKEETNLNGAIRDAYLQRGETNVIVLDWRRLARSNYITAVNGVPAVGRGLGQFIRFLCSVTGANLNSFHIVGFSLGGHLVGNAGRELGGKVARITALDPAGPLWNRNRDRLNRNDAVYVEAIHTDGGYTVGGLGIGSNVANADFYPNGGVSMPGCVTNICNHNRAWRYFASTVVRNHLIGNECANSRQVSTNSCRGRQLAMGNSDLRKSGNGVYRVNTARNYPF